MSPYTLSVPPGHVRFLRFPDRCAECGGSAARSFKLDGGSAALVLPLCERDNELKTLKQVAWIAGCLLVGIGLAVGLGVAADAALDPSFARQWSMPIALAIFGVAFVPLWLGLRRRRTAFHRRFSAVYVAEVGKKNVDLVFRSPLLQRDVAVLSGITGVANAVPDLGYRVAASPAPAHHDPRGRKGTPSSTALLLAAIVSIVVGFLEYQSLGAAEARGETIHKVWLEIVVYESGGRLGVLAMFLVLGLVAGVIGGHGVWRALRAPRVA